MDKTLVLFVLALFAGCVAASEAGPEMAVGASAGIAAYADAARQINQNFIAPGLKTAMAALALQMLLIHWKDFHQGDISNTIAKLVGVVSWGGITVLVLQNQSQLSTMFEGYLALAASTAGMSSSDFSPSTIVGMGSEMIAALYGAVARSTEFDPVAIGKSILLSFQLIFVSILIMMAMFVLALSVFMVQLEFWMMFAVAPLIFGLLPLSAFRDQGMAPLKGVMAMGLRIILLGTTIGVAKLATDSMVAKISDPNLPPLNLMGPDMTQLYFVIVGVAAMAISSGKIAASIASGSASFSGSDAIRTGTTIVQTATAGAALGAAAARTVAAPAMAGAKAVGEAVKSMGSQLASRGRAKVTPVGGPTGGSTAFGEFGGSLNQPRPSPLSPNAASSSGSAGTAPPSSAATSVQQPRGTNTPTGNTNTAGIGGSTSALERQGPSALQRIGDAASRAAEHHATQDQGSVSIAMNTRGD